MITIVCDSCRKHIMNPIRDENYFPLLHKDLCADCHKKLREKVEDVMVASRPHYSFEGHKKQFLSTLDKMTR